VKSLGAIKLSYPDSGQQVASNCVIVVYSTLFWTKQWEEKNGGVFNYGTARYRREGDSRGTGNQTYIDASFHMLPDQFPKHSEGMYWPSSNCCHRFKIRDDKDPISRQVTWVCLAELFRRDAVSPKIGNEVLSEYIEDGAKLHEKQSTPLQF
jgi:hypothetical protein